MLERTKQELLAYAAEEQRITQGEGNCSIHLYEYHGFVLSVVSTADYRSAFLAAFNF